MIWMTSYFSKVTYDNLTWRNKLKMKLKEKTISEIIRLDRERERDDINAIEEGIESILKEDPNRAQIIDIIDGLSDEEKSELLALMWFGRGTPDDWQASLQSAKKSPKDEEFTPYLLGKLGRLHEYLTNALNKLRSVGKEI